jgi:hypothetical protein
MRASWKRWQEEELRKKDRGESESWKGVQAE